MTEGPDWLSDAPERFRSALRQLASGDAPANLALMWMLTEARAPEEAGQVLAEATARAVGEAAERLRSARTVLARQPDAWATVRGVLAVAEHAGGAPDRDPVAHWASVFDRLAAVQPEAGVALYALGSPDLLSAATDEVVARLDAWGLVGPDRHVLEIGCGIGRFVRALAARVATVTGLDVSAAMIAEARRRCADLANVRLETSSGRDLAAIQDGTLDLVLAADVFPYLVLAGGDLPERHVAEAARVLRPGGAIAVLNYSYRGDPERDRAEVAVAFSQSGFALERAGTREFAMWDAVAFVARKV